MFIQTELTPNPDVLKFIPGRPVMGEAGIAEFKTADDAAASPMAARLFRVNGVQSVFLGRDFISVTRTGAVDWGLLKLDILSALMEHFASGAPVLNGAVKSQVAGPPAVEDDEITAQIKELIETRVRPSVAMDGGDIVFHSFEDGIVYLKMQGACSGCPSSTVTLKSGIENMLKHFIPEVTEVRPVAD